MASGGELKAIFEGAQEDLAQAVESAANKMGSFGDATAQNVRDSVKAIQDADGASADSLRGIRDEVNDGGAEPGKGSVKNWLSRLLNGEDPGVAGRERLTPERKYVAVSAENGSPRLFKRLFPDLTDVNSPRLEQGPEWQHNCISCVNAVDHSLDGNPASAVPVPAPPAEFPWPDGVTETIGGGKPFVKVDSYDDIEKELSKAGPGSRGVIWGRRFERIGSRLIEAEGHVFNVVNRSGRVFYIDGQTGSFAPLEHFDIMHFVRTK